MPKHPVAINQPHIVPAVQMPGTAKAYITYPQEILTHWVTDEELGQLNELRKDYVVELFWGFLGVAAGSALPAISVAKQFVAKVIPLEVADLITLCSFFIFLALTLIMGVFWYQRSKRATDLIAGIRKRPKAPVEIDR